MTIGRLFRGQADGNREPSSAQSWKNLQGASLVLLFCLDIGLVSHVIPVGWHRIRFPRAGFLSGTWGNIFSKIPARGFITFALLGVVTSQAS